MMDMTLNLPLRVGTANRQDVVDATDKIVAEQAGKGGFLLTENSTTTKARRLLKVR